MMKVKIVKIIPLIDYYGYEIENNGRIYQFLRDEYHDTKYYVSLQHEYKLKRELDLNSLTSIARINPALSCDIIKNNISGKRGTNCNQTVKSKFRPG